MVAWQMAWCGCRVTWWHVVCVMVAWLMAWCGVMCLRHGHGRVTDGMMWMSRDWWHDVFASWSWSRDRSHDVAWCVCVMAWCGCRVTDGMMWMSRDWWHDVASWSRDMWPYIIKGRSSVHESFLNNYKWYKCCDDVLFWISLKWDVWRVKKG